MVSRAMVGRFLSVGSFRSDGRMSLTFDPLIFVLGLELHLMFDWALSLWTQKKKKALMLFRCWGLTQPMRLFPNQNGSFSQATLNQNSQVVFAEFPVVSLSFSHLLVWFFFPTRWFCLHMLNINLHMHPQANHPVPDFCMGGRCVGHHRLRDRHYSPWEQSWSESVSPSHTFPVVFPSSLAVRLSSKPSPQHHIEKYCGRWR